MISETISDDGETSEKHDHEDQPMSLSINDIKTYVYTYISTLNPLLHMNLSHKS